MILISGTVTSAVQLQTLNSKWQQKKASGDVLSKEERNERANWTQEDWLKHDFEEQAARERETNKKTDIDNKILAGGSLTPDEEKYLEQEDPSALQKYRQIKAEKKEYEEKLKNCRTKDEVQRLKTETMGEYAASMKKVENDPYIPMSEKLAKAQELLAKTRNVQEVERKFMQSPEYDKLPTEAEEAQERSEEREINNEQILEKIEEAVSDTDDEEMTGEDEAVDGDENADISDKSEDDNKKRVNTDDVDILQDIEETYYRIHLNTQIDDENVNTGTHSAGKYGGQIDITV